MSIRRSHQVAAGREERSVLCLVAALCLALMGCSGPDVDLGVAPNVYSDYDFYPESAVPVAERTVTPDLYYVTDRNRITGTGGAMRYGHDRSDAMVFGRSRVRIGDGMDWSDLVAFSARADPDKKVTLRVIENTELVRFATTPLPFSRTGGAMQILPKARADYTEHTRRMQSIIAAQLRAANRREVLIYVHGFRSDFDNSQATLANIWHFSGRIGVPILYSWPANNPGPFGYFKDREAGEFTIFHLKQFLTMLAGIPELQKIQIVAHSRGADVTTTALRELMIGQRAAGRDPRKTLKVDNLIMAAPDIDFGVVRQRLIAERFATAFGQITVYLNKRDGALGIAQTLMSGVRMGRMSIRDMDAEVRETFRLMGNVHFIDVERPGNSISHSYFRDNPAVVSDIVLTLRTSAPPGGDDRPLQPLGANFWALRSDYPDPARGSTFAKVLGLRKAN